MTLNTPNILIGSQSGDAGYLYLGNAGINSAVIEGDSSGNLYLSYASGKKLYINAVAYAFPSSQGSASTYLKNDGSGNLSWSTVSTSGITALTGDVTASGSGSVAATLATVNSNVGSFTNASITVNAKGLITAASSGSASANTSLSNLSSVSINTTLLFSSDNAYNIGASGGVNRPANGYFAGNMFLGGSSGSPGNSASILYWGATTAATCYITTYSSGTRFNYVSGSQHNFTVNGTAVLQIGAYNSASALDIYGGVMMDNSAGGSPNLIWYADNTNNIGAIGTNRPANVYVANYLQVGGSLATGNGPGSIQASYEGSGSSNNNFLHVYYYDSASGGVGGNVIMGYAPGTMASTTPVQSGNILGKLVYRGTRTNGGALQNSAVIQAVAAQTYTSSAIGTSLQFEVAANNTTGLYLTMSLDQSGSMTMQAASGANLLWNTNLAGSIGLSGGNQPSNVFSPIVTLTPSSQPGSPIAGMIIFNSGTSTFQGYNGTAWVSL